MTDNTKQGITFIWALMLIGMLVIVGVFAGSDTAGKLVASEVEALAAGAVNAIGLVAIGGINAIGVVSLGIVNSIGVVLHRRGEQRRRDLHRRRQQRRTDPDRRRQPDAAAVQRLGRDDLPVGTAGLQFAFRFGLACPPVVVC